MHKKQPDDENKVQITLSYYTISHYERNNQVEFQYNII